MAGLSSVALSTVRHAPPRGEGPVHLGRGCRSPWLTLGEWLVLLVTVLAALVPLGPGSVAKAEGPVTMQAMAGFDGRGRVERWVPVVVDVQNDGPDLVAELQVADPGTGPRYGGPPPGYSSQYLAEVVLPRGARKRFTLYAPLNSAGVALPVQLVGQGKVLASVDVNIQAIGQGALLAGILSRKPGALASLGAVQLHGGGRQVILARLRPPDLPPTPESLDNFDFLALADFESADLSPEQVAALEGWVVEGGTLFVAGGPEWRRTLAGLPSSLRPVDVQGTADLGGLQAVVDLAGAAELAGNVVVARGTVHAGRVLAMQEDIPLVVEAAVGAGKVVFLAFDPSLEPVASWSGGRLLWEELLARALPAALLGPPAQGGPPGLYGRNPGGVVASALGNLPSLDLPSGELLLGLLGGYVLLIGPLNYLVLRRLRRSELVWLTVPALALVFGGGTYLLALHGKGGTVLTHAISVVHLSPGVAQQRVQSYIGLFAPAETSYRLAVASTGLVSALGSGYSPRPGQGDLPVGIRVRREAGRSVVDLVGMEMWSMRGIALEERRSGEGELAADLRIRGGKLVGTVANGTGRDWKDAVVVAGGSFQRLGDLPAGERAPVDLALASAIFNPKGGPPIFYQIYAPPTPTPAPPPGSIPRPGITPAPTPVPPQQPDRELMRKQQILGSLFNPSVGAGGALEEPVLLLAWADAAPITFEVEGQATRVVQTTLVIAPLRPAYEGAFELPAGFIRGKLIAADRGYLGWSPGGFQFAEGSVTVQLELPAVADLQLDELTVDVPAMSSLPSSPLVDAQLYNWQTRQWDSVPVAMAAVPALPSPFPMPVTVAAPPASVRVQAPPLPAGAAAPGTAPTVPSAAPTAPAPARGTPTPAPTLAPAIPPGYYPGQGYVVVRQGATAIKPYVSPDGLLRVKLLKTSRDTLSVGAITLALKGRVGE